MDTASLKNLAVREIDRHAEELIALGKSIWNEAEPGYEEVKTSAKVREFFERMDLPIQKNLALTGFRADWKSGRPGPRLAIMGELDALVIPEHPEANPENGAVHACGHNMQPCAMTGAALALMLPEIREALSGNLAFIACPAEEGRLASLRPGVRFVAGKAELIYNGVLDDVDLAMMTHASSGYGICEGSNGMVMKKVVFRGRSCHAGHPAGGVNALTAARSALNLLDSQRDLFEDEDKIRIHGIVKADGIPVNVIPGQVELEYMVRGRRLEAIIQASELFDRCMRGAALAFGASADIETRHGYMPMNTDMDMKQIHEENFHALNPDGVFENFGWAGSSTDMGDVSMIMPVLHPYSGAWTGACHSLAFHWKDDREAFVEPAKLMAMDAIDLLTDNADRARKIIRKTPPLTRTEYRHTLDELSRIEHFPA